MECSMECSRPLCSSARCATMGRNPPIRNRKKCSGGNNGNVCADATQPVRRLPVGAVATPHALTHACVRECVRTRARVRICLSRACVRACVHCLVCVRALSCDEACSTTARMSCGYARVRASACVPVLVSAFVRQVRALVRACARACVRACIVLRVLVRACMRVCVRACICACMLCLACVYVCCLASVRPCVRAS